ncbi:MAG: hypothetical protein IJT27_06250 [Clostridia bacterium]|nr:hypothetical protein [Clostridia bacterium]
MGGYKKFALTAALSFVILCASEGLRLFADVRFGGFVSALCNHFTFFIFFGMLAAWGVSIRRRVMRDDLRRLLLAAEIVMMLWLLLRSARFFYAFSPYAADRLLWYAYYIPIIALPLLHFYVSLCVCGAEGERPRRPMLCLSAAAAALAGLVLTNDLHGWAFRFSFAPSAFAVYDGSGETYAYGPVFFIVAAWVALLELSAVLLVIRSRAYVPGRKKYLPLAVFAASVAYCLGYWKSPTFFGVGFIELTVGVCWFSVMIWESCICTGLIPGNTRYADFFHASSLRLQITDFFGAPYLSSPGAGPLDEETFAALKREGTLVCNEDTQLHAYPVNCGYSVWQEDIGALTDMIAELKLNAEELREGNALEERQFAARRRRERIREENRLYGLISEFLEPDFAGIRAQLDRLDAETDDDLRRKMLARINLAGVFLKRRGNAVMIAESGERITEEELSFCMAELAENMRLCDLEMTCSVSLPAGVSLPAALWIYRTLQTLTDALIGRCARIFLLLTARADALRFSLTAYTGADGYPALSAAAAAVAPPDGMLRTEEEPAENCVCFFSDYGGEVQNDA